MFCTLLLLTLFIVSFFLLLSQPVANADFIVPVEIDGVIHQVYVLKRPHVDKFLKRMGEMFECVLFTASLAKVEKSLVCVCVCVCVCAHAHVCMWLSGSLLRISPIMPIVISHAHFVCLLCVFVFTVCMHAIVLNISTHTHFSCAIIHKNLWEKFLLKFLYEKIILYKNFCYI